MISCNKDGNVNPLKFLGITSFSYFCMVFAIFQLQAKAKPNRKIGTESHGSTERVDSRVAFELKIGGNYEGIASRIRLMWIV